MQQTANSIIETAQVMHGTTNSITKSTNSLVDLSSPTSTSTTEPGPPRKRSKVSRACDECRRKKVCFCLF